MTRLERAEGRLAIELGPRGARRIAEQGCLKARFPRHSGHCEAVLINTAGGIAGGDTLRTAIEAGPGTDAVLTTQAAERVYRARDEDGDASVGTRLVLAPGAALDWLPQELILFDGARIDRRQEVRLGAGARFTGVEAVVLGRRASGERIGRLAFRDLLRIECEGRLLLHDATRLADASHAARASLGDATAWATVVHAAPDAAARLGALRAALPADDAGASEIAPGLVLARILAADGAALRRAVLAALDTLRGPRQAPRTWQC